MLVLLTEKHTAFALSQRYLSLLVFYFVLVLGFARIEMTLRRRLVVNFEFKTKTVLISHGCFNYC